jgi:hypothetical protein
VNVVPAGGRSRPAEQRTGLIRVSTAVHLDPGGGGVTDGPPPCRQKVDLLEESRVRRKARREGCEEACAREVSELEDVALSFAPGTVVGGDELALEGC